MKPKTLIPLVVGLAVGFLAIKMGLDMVNKAKGTQPGSRTIYIAARNIEVASLITEDMIKPKTIPDALVPADVVKDKEMLINRVSAMTITPGVPIARSMLAPPGAEPGLRAKIPPGYRAVSVKVNEETAVAGFISPGCRVDVSSVPRGGGGKSKQILEDVEVGAVGQSLSEVGPDGKTVRITKSVTLFLTPEQVLTLNAHSGSGKVHLALRGNTAPHEKPFWNSLLKNALAHAPRPVEKPKPAPKPRKKAEPEPPRHVVEVYRGTDREEVVFVGDQVISRLASRRERSDPRAMGMIDDLQMAAPPPAEEVPAPPPLE